MCANMCRSAPAVYLFCKSSSLRQFSASYFSAPKVSTFDTSTIAFGGRRFILGFALSYLIPVTNSLHARFCVFLLMEHSSREYSSIFIQLYYSPKLFVCFSVVGSPHFNYFLLCHLVIRSS